MSKAAQTRAFIIEKTAAVFNKKGYAGTSLTDLTEATGLTKGALYGNFKSKDEIAVAAFEYNVQKVSYVFPDDGKQTVIDRLLAIPAHYKKRFVTVAECGGCPVLNTAVEADDNQPELKEKVNEVIKAWKSQYVQILQEGIDKGEIKPGINPASYAHLFIALFEGGTMLSKVTGDLGYFNDAMNRMTQIIKSELPL